MLEACGAAPVAVGDFIYRSIGREALMCGDEVRDNGVALHREATAVIVSDDSRLQ